MLSGGGKPDKKTKVKAKTAIGKTIKVIASDPWAPIGATDIGKQSREEVEKKS